MNRSRFDTDALVRSVFQDDYGFEASKLEALYSKAKRHQWNAELDVDWMEYAPDAQILDPKRDILSRLGCVQELPDATRHKLYREAAIFTLSQVLHGEQAALMTCGQLVNAVPDVEGKFSAAVQVMDEARHIEVFARYLALLGHYYPIDPDLQAIIQQLLTEPDWEAKCVGMQVILESVALGFFRLGVEMSEEPVLRQFIGRVHEDESRHVAYGVLTLEERIPQLDEPTRHRLENFAYDAVCRIAGRAQPTFTTQMRALQAAGVDAATFFPKLIAEFSNPEGIDFTGLADPIVDTVIPNLIRVGLVPERLLTGYLAQGFRIDLAAGALEDLHTFHPDAKEARAQLHVQGQSAARPW
ncbi:MAG TPA: ferritin-like domain-containing protein [Myxococcota bacterium]|nr:ferritin-like domain-containing protein [Myxococcota bacterium]